MLTLLGIIGLLILVGAGCALIHLAYQEEDLLVLLTMGMVTSLLLLMVWAALLLPFLSMETTLILAVLVGLVPLGLVLRKRPAVKLDLHWAEALFLLVGAVGTVAYGWAFLSMRMVVEDSFFVHTSNTGLMLNGTFPPTNFLGDELKGHYGRDLMVALLSRLTSIQYLDVEWFLRGLANGMAFLVAYCWFRKDTGHKLQAACGATFLMVGSNFCSYVGQMDLLNNNLAVAGMAWIFTSYTLFRVLEGKGWWLTGLILGSEALLYEIHFVMMGAAVLVLVLFMKPPEGLTQLKRLRWLAMSLILAAFLSVVEGGAISHLVKGKLGLTEVNLNTHHQMQAQHVSVEIPKEKLFQVRTDNLRPSRPFETRLRPWSVDYTPTDHYVPIWSKKIRDTYWYPVWLVPFTLFWLLRVRSGLAFWFFCLGGLGSLVPSLIGFGYFEQETGRWLSYTATGWSTAFGLMVGWLLTRPLGKARIFATIFGLWALWFGTAGLWLELSDMRNALANPGQQMPDGPGRIQGAGILPDPALSLSYHYKFEEGDWEAAAWLRANADPQERFLMNYGDEAPRLGFRPRILSGGLLNRRGCMVGLAGIRPVGITGGPENELAAPNFSPALQTWIFWGTGDVRLLKPLKPDWVVANESTLAPAIVERLHSDSRLEKRFHSKGRTVFRFLGDDFAPLPATPGTALIATRPEQNPRVRQFFRVPIQTVDLPHPGCTVEVRYRHLEMVANARDMLTIQVTADMEFLPLAAPHVAGSYQVEYRFEGQEDWSPLTPIEVLPDEL